jgi:hypothetical protein
MITSMSFKILYHFATLQIPDIHLVIFAPRDNPLPPSNAETSRYTELLVAMAHVCFQAARGVIVP